MNKVIVTYSDPGSNIDFLYLRPGMNLITGAKNFSDEFGTLTSLEQDLLVLSSAIFASDLAIKRGKREEITRKIELTVPVVNIHLFNSILDELKYALYRLSHDAWDINFINRVGSIDDYESTNIRTNAKVLLFSGGLDSASAGLEFGAKGNYVELVSHITGNQTIIRAQEDLYKYLDSNFPNQFHHLSFRVGGRNRRNKNFTFPTDNEREDTQRTRSLLFLTLAAMVARRRGIRDVVIIAENGQLAINLPLTASRISAFSTHTAHPEFLLVIGNILSTLLNFQINIENPYLYLTKAEVVKNLVKSHKSIIDHAISCWRASRVTGKYRHCGECIPCIIRRIAIEFHGVKKDEYKRDLFQEDISQVIPGDEGIKNIKELALFIEYFSKKRSQASIEDEYPDLINPAFSSVEASKLYSRFSREALKVFGHYPNVLNIFV